jgi:hypothetical protein
VVDHRIWSPQHRKIEAAIVLEPKNRRDLPPVAARRFAIGGSYESLPRKEGIMKNILLAFMLVFCAVGIVMFVIDGQSPAPVVQGPDYNQSVAAEPVEIPVPGMSEPDAKFATRYLTDAEWEKLEKEQEVKLKAQRHIPLTVNDLYSGHLQGQQLLVKAQLIGIGYRDTPQVAFGDVGGIINCLVSPREFYELTADYVVGDEVTFRGIFVIAERRNGAVLMRHCQLSK